MKTKSALVLFLLPIFLSLSFVLFFLPRNTASAAGLTSMSDTLSRLEVSQPANHTIQFVTSSGVDASTDTIILTFDPAGQAYNLTGVTYTDIELAVDNDANCDGSWTGKTLGTTAGASVWGVNVNTSADTITFTAPTNATTGEIATNRCVQIKIGTHVSGGANRIVNPTNPGSYNTTISGTFGDTGAYTVAILTDDQIDVTAQVDPTLSVTISTNSCPLGLLSANYIKTCNYNVTVSTNAVNGYVSTILSDGLLRNTLSDINNATTGVVRKGVEEYGVGTSKAGQTILQNAACTDMDTGVSQPATELTTSAKQFANSSGPVSNDATTVCHLASITGVTPAGSYAQVATIIVTATF